MTTDIGEIEAGATPRITCTLTEEDGETPIPLAALTTLTLKLVDVRTAAVVNGRNAQSILNANGGTVSSDGAVEWIGSPSDTALLTASTPLGSHELRHGVLAWTWDSGARAGRRRFSFRVQNIDPALA